MPKKTKKKTKPTVKKPAVEKPAKKTKAVATPPPVVEVNVHEVFLAKVKDAANVLLHAMHNGSDNNVVLVEQAVKNTLAKAHSLNYVTEGVDYDPFGA